MRVKVFCAGCRSESEVEHDMDTNYYLINHCPFCGDEVDEDLIEVMDEHEERF